MSTVATGTPTSVTPSMGTPSSSLTFMSRSQSKKFPFKCHEMLAYSERNGLEHIVSWVPGGKGFCVHNHKEFCQRVLKATFSHSNFKSFEKQLNNWGFDRDVNEKGNKIYSNPSFIRGRKSLCQTMTSKSTQKKAAIVEAVTASTTKTAYPAATTSNALYSIGSSFGQSQYHQQRQQQQVSAATSAAILTAARQQQQLMVAAALLNNQQANGGPVVTINGTNYVLANVVSHPQLPMSHTTAATTTTVGKQQQQQQQPQQPYQQPQQQTTGQSSMQSNGRPSQGTSVPLQELQLMLLRRHQQQAVQNQIRIQQQQQQQQQKLNTTATNSTPITTNKNTNSTLSSGETQRDIQHQQKQMSDHHEDQQQERAAALLALRHAG